MSTSSMILHNDTSLDIEKPQRTKSNIFLFVAVLGFILLFISWYQVQSILWNRIRYNSGSGWETAAPIYLNAPIEELRHNLISNLILYGLGYTLILCSSLFILTKIKFNRITDFVNDYSKLSFTLAIFHGLATITGFWLKNSPWVIATLKLNVDIGNPGEEWIYGSSGIGKITPAIETLSLLITIISLILTIFLGIITIIRYYKSKEEKKRDRTFTDIVRNILQHIPFYLILIFYLIFTLLPVYLTIKVSISTFSGVLTADIEEPLRAFILNYSSVTFTVSNDETQFGSAFLRSILLGIGTGTVGLAISIPAAYSLARFKFKGNKLMTFLIISTQMFPGLILLIPQYIIWSNLGLLREDIVLFGVLLASSTGATAYCTWMMKGYFESVPLEIEEAAIIDGAGSLGTFIKIALPLVKSGIIAVLLFTLITSWQDFVLARTFINQGTKETLPLIFYNFQDLTKNDAPVYFDLVAPYSILVALPIVVFFMIFQKDLAAGAVAGGVK